MGDWKVARTRRPECLRYGARVICIMAGCGLTRQSQIARRL